MLANAAVRISREFALNQAQYGNGETVFGFGFAVENAFRTSHSSSMSKVEKIEAELEKLSAPELREIRNWLDDFLEDQLQFTDEFEAQVAQSEGEMKSGIRPRIRRSDMANAQPSL